jgi:hypothetical protein
VVAGLREVADVRVALRFLLVLLVVQAALLHRVALLSLAVLPLPVHLQPDQR